MFRAYGSSAWESTMVKWALLQALLGRFQDHGPTPLITFF
jgi:hypothetical protein